MFEAYRIGVTIALTNQVTGGLVGMSKQFLSTEKDAAKLKATLNEIKLLGTAGAALGAVGVAGLSALKGPLEEASKFQQQVAKFKLFGLGDQMTEEAAKYAKSMNSMGTSATENMRLMVEAQGVFREAGLQGPAALEGAKLAAPTLANIDYATSAFDDESKARMHSQSLSMLRFVEMRGGLQSPEAFNNIADAGWKAIQSSGGNVNWEQMRQFMARGGVAAQGMSNEALFAKMEPIIGEMKGSAAGTAYMTAYNRLIGGVKVPNQVAHLLADNGIWDEKKIEWNSQGGVKRFNGNPLIAAATLNRDPVEFYEKNILPMYAKMNGGKGLSQDERNRENLLIFGRTGGAMFSLIDKQLATIHKSVAANEKALGIKASVDVTNETMAGQMLRLHKQWSDLMLELGVTVLPLAIKAARGLIDILKPMIQWMREHERLTKALVIAFAGLSILATIGGMILVFTAALKGLMIFGSVGGALIQATGAATGLIPMVGKVAGQFFGLQSASAAASLSLGGVLVLMARIGAVGIVADQALKVVDPKDHAGAWMDRNFQWASDFDDWSKRNIGLGRSYAEQREVEADRQKDIAAGKKSWWEVDTRRLGPALGMKQPEKADGAGFAAMIARSKQRHGEQQTPLTADQLASIADIVSDKFTASLNGAQVNMDGRQVGSLVMKQMDRSANRPPEGSSTFDYKLSPAYPTGGLY